MASISYLLLTLELQTMFKHDLPLHLIAALVTVSVTVPDLNAANEKQYDPSTKVLKTKLVQEKISEKDILTYDVKPNHSIIVVTNSGKKLEGKLTSELIGMLEQVKIDEQGSGELDLALEKITELETKLAEAVTKETHQALLTANDKLVAENKSLNDANAKLTKDVAGLKKAAKA